MKHLKIISVIFIFFFYFNNSFSEQIEFKSEKINVTDDGNTIIAFKSNTFIPDKNILVVSDKVNYDKNKKFLVFSENVYLHDKFNNLIIKSNLIEYDEKSNIISSYGNTQINLDNNYEIDSKDIFYNRLSHKIYGKNDTFIYDKEGNIFKLRDKFNINIKKKLVNSKSSIVIDKNENKYIFEDLMIDLEENKIAGREIKVKFKKTYFGNEKNDPILKGKSSYSDDKELKIYKTVFSTCNINNKKCRGWELSADEFKHDKEKKLFEYKKSWLKLFDYKLFYLPYFNHPDPSVKRKSGFLAPSYSSSDSLGTAINVPYFKVLSNDKDITYKPRIYADKSFLLQNEYRQALQSSKVNSDFSFLIGSAGTKGHLFYNQVGDINSNINFELNLQNVKGDNYLKTHKLIDTSSLISSDSLLVSNLDINWIFKDSSLSTSFKLYEDLSRNYHDRYQYIFPNFNFVKKIEIPDSYNGNFNFNSYGFNKLYDTNVSETVLTNDFLFSSNEYISKTGLSSNYDILIKNSNNYSKNSTNYNENLNYNLFGIAKLDTSFPMQKRMKDFTHFLKPILSLRYSPNGNNDLSSKDVLLSYNSVFDLNRIGSNSQVEGGESLSIGLEFMRNNNDGKNILDFKVANVIKTDEDQNMPSKSKLDNKRSDIVGNLNYNLTDNLKLGYFFSYDKDLKYSNIDQLSLDVSVNNFFTNFSYYSEHNDLINVESAKNKSKFFVNEENALSFEISKDLIDSFTEYYNLTYSHETDCISLNLNFNKSFYRDGSLEPSKSLSFLIKIIPFTEIGVQNIGTLVGN